MVMPEVHGRRDDREGPPTYRDPSFSELIANAAGLTPTRSSLRVADFMSRHGKLAAEMQVIAPQHDYTAIALTEGQLSRTPEGIHVVTADVRNLAAVNLTPFHRGIIRYGVKEFRAEEQIDVLSGINQALEEDGVLGLADMIAPDGTENWLNEHHRQKQRFEGRDIQRDGECHIPTRGEWIRLFQDAGFSPVDTWLYTSRVSTTDWVKGKQITEEQREEMDDRLILEAPDMVQKAFNIRVEDGVVKVDYPVIIFKAVKYNTVYEVK